MILRYTWLLILLSLLGLSAAFPQETPSGRIPKVARAPRLEDFLNNTPREAELKITEFRQFDPGDGDPASLPTTAYVSYDAKNLYVAFVCMDDPSKIRAHITRRDAILSDEWVDVAIDTFHDHIFRSKVNYQFSREFSFRAIIDYNSVLPNPSLVSLQRTKRLGLDFLFTYMLHPGTAVHVGYTDNYENLHLDPLASPNLQRTGFPDASVGRQVFVKLSYLFRM